MNPNMNKLGYECEFHRAQHRYSIVITNVFASSLPPNVSFSFCSLKSLSSRCLKSSRRNCRRTTPRSYASAWRRRAGSLRSTELAVSGRSRFTELVFNGMCRWIHGRLPERLKREGRPFDIVTELKLMSISLVAVFSYLMTYGLEIVLIN